MKKLWCFLGVHEYTIHKEGPFKSQLKIGTYYDLRCGFCGKMKMQIL